MQKGVLGAAAALIAIVSICPYIRDIALGKPGRIAFPGKPLEETLSYHAWTAATYVLSIMALTRFSVVTALYPASLLAADLVLIAILAGRRRNRTATVDPQPAPPR